MRSPSPAASTWHLSWPLLMGLAVFVLVFATGDRLLLDGDTFWHLKAGEWIVQHRTVPDTDPFSFSFRGTPWVAHEWLAEVVMHAVHRLASWTGLIALTAACMGLAAGLLLRALLTTLAPVRAIALAAIAVAMVSPHLLARPHVMALPLLVAWAAALVRASDSGQAPPMRLLPLMVLWANLHGGFTLGIALAGAFAVEAVITRPRHERVAVARRWALFLVLSVAAALVTPSGLHGLLFTWKLVGEMTYMHQVIQEWQSASFTTFSWLEAWVLALLVAGLFAGLRLPVMRLVLLLGLVHLSLKHVRNVELLGLLGPLLLMRALGERWPAPARSDGLDLRFERLARRAGAGAAALVCLVGVGATAAVLQLRPLEPSASAPNHPVAAVDAALAHGVTGHVLNDYGLGGYLILRGIAPIIDGRTDLYGDAFLKRHFEAMNLTGKSQDGLQRLISDHDIRWTLLSPGRPAIALLDALPGWCRLYTDDISVVHARGERTGCPAPVVTRSTAP